MSARPAKPLFLNSKGERNEQEGGIYTGFIVEHYRAIAGGSYTWEGCPDDMPQGFIEDTALFFNCGVGMKKVRALGNVILPAKPDKFTIYGRPYSWLPAVLDGMIPIKSDDDLFTSSTDPCLWLNAPVYEIIRPYLDIMKNALMTLNTNINGLNQPVLIKGLPGAELGTLVIKNALDNKDMTIPTTGNAFNAEVLDLKAVDHTQNLISTIDWCDSRILEAMAASNGMEKSSGVTTMETVSGVQSVMQQLQIGLDKRRAWADQVNDRFKTNISVRFGDGIESLMARPTRDEAPAEVSEDESKD